tara:strand:+ start:48 stop:491 length:444 start_codon:yes stop_codon:yes gene_type:complete
MEWYLKVMKNYIEFNGRARRKEYWMFTLLNTIFLILALTIDYNLNLHYFGITVLSTLYYFATLIPALAVSVRRIHDVGKSGWVLLTPVAPYFISAFLLFSFPQYLGLIWVAGILSIISLIGSIWIFVLFCSNSKPGENKYGTNPKES